MSRVLLCLLLLSGLVQAEDDVLAQVVARQAQLKQLLSQGAQLDGQVMQLEQRLQGQRQQLTEQGADCRPCRRRRAAVARFC